ncbi:unnamed protein product [Onchocerca flexuosa]|uniref:Saposin A-type domain-containing protein n=1 Tax=Onchocerca flexuosa TaxID=387005 RepID=A0A3P7WQG7_9BILA|nr:unnamed protein product [Onchocerca flexuosa]
MQCCNIPPDLWCDSYESARRCNVIQQCDQFRHTNLPIKLSLYYEALCPYCQRFISNHLGIIYNQFRGLIELEMIPWGNSKLLQVSIALINFRLLIIFFKYLFISHDPDFEILKFAKSNVNCNFI